jgi:hypothetical protein
MLTVIELTRQDFDARGLTHMATYGEIDKSTFGEKKRTLLAYSIDCAAGGVMNNSSQ